MNDEKRTSRENGFNRASGVLHDLTTRAASSIRMSLTFRIAVHYCWQLMRSFVMVMLLASLVIGGLGVWQMKTEAERIAGTPPAGEAYTQLEIQNRSAGVEMLPQPLPEDGWARFAAQSSYVFSELQGARIGIAAPCAYAPSGWILVRFSLEQQLVFLLLLGGTLLLADASRMIYFLRHQHRLDKRVLAPIQDIADMAATLSTSNLSNRINIAGTKNELRDLAAVINTMLDRIERSYNSQKQFVSDASHELRTPIAVIQGYVSMLQRWGKDDAEVLGESLTAISQETSSMKELVENLLFLARHDKKTLMMEMSSFDPCEMMEELHREAEMVTPEDKFVLAQAEHCQLTADRNMVKQVMRILLDNAVKYTPKGGTITMGVTRWQDGCMLTMRDNGPGISAEELPKIFDRFYRSDAARKAESGGHGLGLSIARIIVVAHGGKIRVRSKVGEGTIFEVLLPQGSMAQ